MNLAIETIGLVKRYGRVTVLDGVSLSVPEGAVYGFLGPNGAGKTTTVRSLLGLTSVDAGVIRILGHDMVRERLAALAQVGALVERPSLYDHLSGQANLELTAIMLGLPKAAVGAALAVVDLERAARKKVAVYSLGMRQRLALARAILGSPRLLMLDEPTNGLDPDGIAKMRDLIRELPARMNGTVFVSSHLLSEIEQIASHVGVMRGGRLVFEGPVARLVGRTASIRIVVDDGERARSIVAAAGAEVASIDGNCLRVRLAEASDLTQASQRINLALNSAGIGVSTIAPDRITLEQAYHHLTERTSRETA